MSGGSNFKNGAFFNAPPFAQIREGTNQWGLVRKMLFERTPDGTPRDGIPVNTLSREVLETARSDAGTHIYRLGHSSILMKFGHDYWLSDPVFSDRASPSQWLGPKRFHQSPITAADMPDIKGVVISHNHYDHLDRRVITSLINKVEQFIVPLGLAKTLAGWGVAPERITELDWWQSHSHGDMTVTATPTQHFSGRGLMDNNKTLWASFVFQYQGEQVFFGSDSGYFDGFKKIAKRFGTFGITMLESGAYDTAWPDVHMTPEQTLQAHIDLGGGALMPIHNATFKLAFHPWHEPLERLTTLAARENILLVTPEIGARVDLSDTTQTARWWQST